MTPAAVKAWSRGLLDAARATTYKDHFNDRGEWAYSEMTFYIDMLRDPARCPPGPWPADDTYANVDAYWRERFDIAMEAALSPDDIWCRDSHRVYAGA